VEHYEDDSLDEASSDFPIPEATGAPSLVEKYTDAPLAPEDQPSDLTEKVRMWRGTVADRFALLELMVDICIAKSLALFELESQNRLRRFILSTVPMGRKIDMLTKLVSDAGLDEPHSTALRNLVGANWFRNFLAHAVLLDTPDSEDGRTVHFLHRGQLVPFPLDQLEGMSTLLTACGMTWVGCPKCSGRSLCCPRRPPSRTQVQRTACR
jgi:hypothetical protein